jgi:AraC-like DNA-binding protein
MRIKEIAHTVGYEHTSSFIRAFERHFMQAPHLYRQKPGGLRMNALSRNRA